MQHRTTPLTKRSVLAIAHRKGKFVLGKGKGFYSVLKVCKELCDEGKLEFIWKHSTQNKRLFYPRYINKEV